MSELIELDLLGKDRDSLLGYAIVYSSTLMSKSDQKLFFEDYHKNKILTLQVTIDGKEVKFSKFIKHIDRQMNRMVKERAEQIIQAKLGRFSDKLESISRAAKREAYRKLNITPNMY